MKVRYKLAGAPLAYTMALVDGTAEPYESFGSSLWSEDRRLSATMRELVFLRSSFVNRCHT